MSLKFSESTLREFARGELRSKTAPGVTMSIKGRWGAGKTFYWSRVVEEEISAPRQKAFEGTERRFSRRRDVKDPVPLARKRYAYVSLFGLNGVEEVKDALVTAVAAGSVRGNGDIASMTREGLTELVGISKTVLEAVPSVGPAVAALGRSLSYRIVKDALVCIDDLERRGKGLSVQDVFGLITQLREEHGCDVVVILNEGALSKKDRAEYERHGEKAVDLHVVFAPTAEESVDVGLPNELVHREAVTAACLRLGITNIRLLQRVAQKVNQLAPYLNGRSNLATDSALKSLVFLTWAYYDSDKGSLPFSVARAGFDPLAFAMMRDTLTSEQKRLETVALKYDYYIGSRLDGAIAGYVENGYIDDAKLKLGLDASDREADRSHHARSLRDAWDLYSLSFEDNEDAFVDALDENFRSSVHDSRVDQLEGAISVLRSIGRDSIANGLADVFVESHLEEIRRGPDASFDSHVVDPYLSQAVARARKQPVSQIDIVSSLRRLGEQGSTSRADLNALASATPYDFVFALHELDGENLASIIRAALDMQGASYALAGLLPIADTLRMALGHLASESKLNAVRVQNLYGVAPAPLHGPWPSQLTP